MPGTKEIRTNAKPVLKEHEATLKKIIEDFLANGTY